MVAVEIRLRPIGLAELQVLLLADFDARDGAVAVLQGSRDSHDLRIESANGFRSPHRYLELDVGNAEIDRSEARRIRLVDAQPVAPGTCRLDMVVALAECEGRAFQPGTHRRQPLED